MVRTRSAVVVLVVACLAACTGGGGGDDAAPGGDGPRATSAPVPPPALVGGIDLDPTDPAAALVGEGLAYGSAPPSATAALESFVDDDEVGGALVRDVYDSGTAARLARVTGLTLDGARIFDELALDGFVDGLLLAAVDAPLVDDDGALDPQGALDDAEVAGVAVRLAERGGASAAAWRRGDLLVVVEGETEGVTDVLARSLPAVAGGASGSLEPATPLPGAPGPSLLEALPGVDVVAFPTGEDDLPAPPPPGFPGGTAVDGRLVIVGGERRAQGWHLHTDPATVTTAEQLDLVVAGAVQQRTGGDWSVRELDGRLVLASDGSDVADLDPLSEGGPWSARAMRVGRDVVLLEGPDPAQVDALVSALVTALDG